MRIFALLGLLVLITAGGPPCCVETEHYLGDPIASEADERMDGEWYGGNGLVIWIRRDSSDPAGVRRASFVMSLDEKDPVSFVNYRAWRTAVDGREYLNLEKTNEHWADKVKPPQRTIVRVEAIKDASVRMRWGDKEVTAEGGARMWLMNTRNIAAAIQAGELQGRVKGEGSDPVVTITATREALRAFIAAKGVDYVFQDNPLQLLRMPNK